MINRRYFFGFGSILAVAAIAPAVFAAVRPKAQAGWQLTDAVWRKRLTAMQYRVLREAHTERPYTHPLNSEKRSGSFVCAGCRLPLFSSQTKYDSGTGWPSFGAPIKGSVGTLTDYDVGFPRTEVHCRRCGGHQGHIFDDGPKPTGKRYCINGAALTFVPA